MAHIPASFVEKVKAIASADHRRHEALSRAVATAAAKPNPAVATVAEVLAIATTSDTASASAAVARRVLADDAARARLLGAMVGSI